MTVSPPPGRNGPVVRRVHKPEETGRAEMLQGSAGEVADQILGLLHARGLVRVNDVSGNVMVLAEHTGLKVSEGTYELIGQARQMASALGCKTEVALLGPRDISAQLGGADVVVSVEHPALGSTCRRPTSEPCSRCWSSGPRGCC